MLAELAGVRRRAVAGEVGRRGDHIGLDRTQAARAQRTVGQVGDAQRNVEPLRHDVDAGVGEVQLDLDAGVFGEKTREQGRDVADAKGHRRGHADAAGGGLGAVARGLFRGIGGGENERGVIGERLACLGQREPARGAVEQ